ncbi:bifunctional diguanylate cyclase/phosphodiesterase [Sulfurimonas sp. MAG313]|nr:bifunctional diguanylate cyclase/phosphodiesterase [Sulfurimonas sp. MAG313]MDF1880955.1 bifunctional diguanylate cyclase/phosphodiesterase [Sulfurimonas sp. MAG313]
MHRLLKRQIKKILGEAYLSDMKFQNFFQLISDFYDEKDKERRLLENALEINSLEVNEANDKLQKMAFYDSLTGLTNRKLFEEELKLTLNQLQRNKRNIALLFFDLDNFKTVNDTLGHDIGDSLLIKIGGMIQKRIRSCDTLARWGGDEFVLLLDELHQIEDCSLIVENIQKAFKYPIKVKGHELQVSFSIGINVYEEGQSSSEMIKNADMAMYKAKENGKNSYAFYTSEIGKKVLSSVKMNTALLKAIENHEFIVMYQPQIEISTGKIVGAEALVRWMHPEDGLIAPNDFIPISEEKGHIIEIGKQVLEQACYDMKEWVTKGYGLKTMAVNLSVKQIRQKEFIEMVKDILVKTKLDSSYLEFEVTETIVMKEYEHTFHTLDTLRDLGITLSIDDFGTGYSSLSYLKKLPIDKIKIDKSFIDDISDDENDVAITKAIIAMSHSLGLNVLAEGVEEESQLKILKELKCEKYQGYYFSRPVPADEFEALLKEQK